MYPLHDRTSEETSEATDRGSALVVGALARAYTLSDTFPLHHPRVREAISSACAGQTEVGIVALDVTEHGFLSDSRRMDDATGRLAEFARGLYEAQVEHLRIDGSLSTEAVALFLFCVRQAAANQDVRIADVLACAGAHSIRVAVSDFGAPSAALGRQALMAGADPAQPATHDPVLETNPRVEIHASPEPHPRSPHLPVVNDVFSPASDVMNVDLGGGLQTGEAEGVADAAPEPAQPAETGEDWWSSQAPGGSAWQEPASSWHQVELDGATDATDATDATAEWVEPQAASEEWTDLGSAQSDSWSGDATEPWPDEAEEDVGAEPVDSWAEEMARWQVGASQSGVESTQEFGRVEHDDDWQVEAELDSELASPAGDFGGEPQFVSPELEAGRVQPDLGEPVPLTVQELRGSGVVPTADPIQHLEPPTVRETSVPAARVTHGADTEVESASPNTSAAPFEPTMLSGDQGGTPRPVMGAAPRPEQNDLGQPQATDGSNVAWVDDDLWITDHWQAEEFRQALLDGIGTDDPQSIAASFDASPLNVADESPALEAADAETVAEPREPIVPVNELAPNQTPAVPQVPQAAPTVPDAVPEPFAPPPPSAETLGQDSAPPSVGSPIPATPAAVIPTPATTRAAKSVRPPAAKRGVDPARLAAPAQTHEAAPISSLIQAIHDFIASDDRDRPEIEQRILAEVRAATAEGPAPVVVDAVETLLYQTSISDRGADGLAGVMVSDEVVTELMERLGEARDDATRNRLTKVCRRLSSDMAPALADALNSVPPRSVRRNYLNAICTMGRDALRQAIPMLDDSRWFIVRNGVDIIGEVAEPESVPILFPILGHADNRVRVATVRAMAKIGGDDAQINLTRALEDESQDVREAAAMAVGHLKAERALRPLLELLDREKDEEFQLVLIRSLGQLGSLDAVSHLEKRAVGGLLFRPSKAVRIAAYRALATIGSPRARQLLLAASEDRDHEVATAARSILTRMRSREDTQGAPARTPEHAPVG